MGTDTLGCVRSHYPRHLLMLRFHYTARDSHGQKVTGTLQARSADSVARQLLNHNLVPIVIQQQDTDNSAVHLLQKLVAARLPTLADLILFCHQMRTLTKAGVPIVKAMQSLADSTRNARLRNALYAIVEDLVSGRELAVAMTPHKKIFSSLFINTVRVGEETGRLDQAFAHLGRYLEREKDTRDRIKSALQYPFIVIIAIAAAMTIISVMVIPAFANLFANAQVELPIQTRIIIAVSDFMVAHWALLLALLSGLVVGARLFLQTQRGRFMWDRYKFSLPIVGNIIYRATVARFARAFAMALASGVPLLQAMSAVALAVDNRYMQHKITQMSHGIERGDSLTHMAQTSGLFPPMVVQMIEVGEESGSIDELLTEVAEFYERDIDYAIKNLSTLIEPILLSAIGVMVLILALGVFLPMWDMYTLFKK